MSFQRSVWFSLDAGGRMRGSLAWWCALKSSSIAFAPRLSTGRNSLRYTFSVVRVFAWPTRCAMSSIGIPALDSRETKLCRSSRGVQSSARSPASSATWRKARRTLAASSGVPSCVVKTRSLSGHRAPLRMRLWVCQRLCVRSATTQSFGSSKVRRESRVLVSPPSRTDRHSCTLGGSPSRSVWLQVSARNSSVRAPVSNETTM